MSETITCVIDLICECSILGIRFMCACEIVPIELAMADKVQAAPSAEFTFVVLKKEGKSYMLLKIPVTLLALQECFGHDSKAEKEIEIFQ